MAVKEGRKIDKKEWAVLPETKAFIKDLKADQKDITDGWMNMEYATTEQNWFHMGMVKAIQDKIDYINELSGVDDEERY